MHSIFMKEIKPTNPHTITLTTTASVLEARRLTLMHMTALKARTRITTKKTRPAPPIFVTGYSYLHNATLLIANRTIRRFPTICRHEAHVSTRQRPLLRLPPITPNLMRVAVSGIRFNWNKRSHSSGALYRFGLLVLIGLLILVIYIFFD